MSDWQLPMDRRAFLRFMETIDSDLKSRGSAIAWRPILAIKEACLRLSVDLKIAPLTEPAVSGTYTVETLPAHIKEWYENRYGERLKTDLGPGSVAILLKGDPWRMILPTVFGEVHLTCSPDISSSDDGHFSGRNAPIPKYNVLRAVDGLPQGLARDLTDTELEAAWRGFFLGMNVLSGLRRIREYPFVSEMLVDIESAVRHLVGPNPHYGMSHWASLQFTEKAFKCFLSLEGIRFPRSHDLVQLAQLAAARSHLAIQMVDVESVQCDPGVRYGQSQSTMDDALLAHHASMRICETIVGKILEHHQPDSG